MLLRTHVSGARLEAEASHGAPVEWSPQQPFCQICTVSLYNAPVKTWDVICIGAGIIGLATARELRKRGFSVLVLERGEPGREASYAAAGMLVGAGQEHPPALRELASASARMYLEFVHEIEDEARSTVDLRSDGTILVGSEHEQPLASTKTLSSQDLVSLEPALAGVASALWLEERSVDPRALTAAVLKACLHRGVEVSSGEQVVSVNVSDSHVRGVTTQKTNYAAPAVVNCAGVWAGHFPPYPFPTRPVKGQMLAVVSKRKLLRHVLRSSNVYIVPRSDGRILIGASVEDAGYDKRVMPETIQRMHRDAIQVVPALSEARLLEDWAGLRPGTPDTLPFLGATDTAGYYVGAGHYRDGILLAPVTASILGQVIAGEQCAFDLSAFSPHRFLQRDRLRAG
jgi:glycine oxidase